MGTYNLYYTVKLTAYSDQNIEDKSASFQVQILDACDEPFGINVPQDPPTFAVYTVTETLVYQFPEFISDPIRCAVTYSYDISPSNGE